MDMTRASKKLSYLLRHDKDFIDEHGWAPVIEVIHTLKKEWPEFDEECLLKIVRTDEKGRYSYDEAGVRIRANQGHSVPVGVELKEAFMPEEWGRRVYILSVLKSGLADPKGSCGVYRASVSGTSNRT